MKRLLLVGEGETLLVFALLSVSIALSEGTLLDGLVLWLPLNGTYADFTPNKVSIFAVDFSYATGVCNNSQGAGYWTQQNSYLYFLRTVLTPLETSKNFTLSVWGKFRTATSPIIGTTLGEWTWFLSSGSMTFQFSSTSVFADPTTFIDVSIFHHYSLVCSSGTHLYFYVDGTLIYLCNLSSPTFLFDSSRIRIGRSTDFVTAINGSMEDLRIYNRSLTLNEIQQLYYSNPCMKSKQEISSSDYQSNQQQTQSSSNINSYTNINSNINSYSNSYSNNDKFSSSKQSKYYVVVIIEFDIIITDITQLENEIAILIGIDQNSIDLILVSSTEVQVTINGQSLTIVQENVNQLIEQIKTGEITDGILRNAIDAWIRDENNSKQLSFSQKHSHFNFYLFAIVILSL